MLLDVVFETAGAGATSVMLIGLLFVVGVPAVTTIAWRGGLLRATQRSL